MDGCAELCPGGQRSVDELPEQVAIPRCADQMPEIVERLAGGRESGAGDVVSDQLDGERAAETGQVERDAIGGSRGREEPEKTAEAADLELTDPAGLEGILEQQPGVAHESFIRLRHAGCRRCQEQDVAAIGIDGARRLAGCQRLAAFGPREESGRSDQCRCERVDAESPAGGVGAGSEEPGVAGAVESICGKRRGSAGAFIRGVLNRRRIGAEGGVEQAVIAIESAVAEAVAYDAGVHPHAPGRSWDNDRFRHPVLRAERPPRLDALDRQAHPTIGQRKTDTRPRQAGKDGNDAGDVRRILSIERGVSRC